MASDLRVPFDGPDDRRAAARSRVSAGEDVQEPAVSSPPSAAPPQGDSARGAVDADELLAAFLRQRDVACAGCGYNLRDLASGHCPECRQRLVLSVDVESRGFWSVVGSVAPGCGCALIWLFFALMTALEGPPLTRGRRAVAFWGLWAFLTASVFVAAVVARSSRRIFGRPGPHRIAIPIVIWAVHLVALVLFVALID